MEATIYREGKNWRREPAGNHRPFDHEKQDDEDDVQVIVTSSPHPLLHSTPRLSFFNIKRRCSSFHFHFHLHFHFPNDTRSSRIEWEGMKQITATSGSIVLICSIISGSFIRLPFVLYQRSVLVFVSSILYNPLSWERRRTHLLTSS